MLQLFGLAHHNFWGFDIKTFSSSFKEYMPFRETYMTAFKNDIEYSQLVLHTVAVLQSNKFVQVIQQKQKMLVWNGNWIV